MPPLLHGEEDCGGRTVLLIKNGGGWRQKQAVSHRLFSLYNGSKVEAHPQAWLYEMTSFIVTRQHRSRGHHYSSKLSWNMLLNQ